MACTALLYHHPRPDIMKQRTVPSVVRTLCLGFIIVTQNRMDTFGTSWTGKDYSFTHNDAIEGAIVSLGCTIFFCRGDYLQV